MIAPASSSYLPVDTCEQDFECPPPLSVLDVAAWQLPHLRQRSAQPSRFLPGIPSLQRGAVWKPRQIEVLWDSILRGFPIGSFVVCQRSDGLRDQKVRTGLHGKMAHPEEFTHLLLDGQQRGNAIALGFVDAFDKTIEGHGPWTAMLWIDLLPGILLNGLPRRFLLRVTTKAHPWGFKADEASSRLGVEAIRSAEQKAGVGQEQTAEQTSRDVDLTKTWPHHANCPVPLAWLLDAAFQRIPGNELFQSILEKSKQLPDALHEIVREQLGQEPQMGEALPFAPFLKRALGRIPAYRLNALEVPLDALSSQESGTDSDLSDVEHLFQRLNSEGTRLEGDELAYSMIKAYWPGVEDLFAKLPRRPIAEARLANLGMRAALIDEQNDLAPKLKISNIRAMAHSKEDKRRDLVLPYLGLAEQVEQSSIPFVEDLKQVDEWLLWRASGSTVTDKRLDPGIPPVLRTSLTRSSPETFLLLVQIAKATRSRSEADRENLRIPILGLATALHWFGQDDSDRMQAANRAWRQLCEKDFATEAFDGILQHCMARDDRKGMIPLISGQHLDEAMQEAVSTHPDMGKWTPWFSSIGRHQESEKELATSRIWPFISRLRDLRSLVLYSQRQFMGKFWPDFDQADVVLWEDHNCQWDYDHILALATLYNKKRDLCCRVAGQEWLRSIGNIRIWPLSWNRSKSDGKFDPARSGELEDCCIDACEVPGFQLDTDDFNEAEKTVHFLNAARGRMLRMYKDWYDSLDIARLVGTMQEAP